MRRVIYVFLCVVLCALYCFPAFADDWEVYIPEPEDIAVPYYFPASVDVQDPVGGDEDEYDEWADVDLINDLATGSDARAVSTPSNAAVGSPPVVYSSYAPYDSSISTSVVSYMEDLLPRLGMVDYVLFRSGQYTYRLVYSRDMVCAGGNFSAGDADYVLYDTRNYTLEHGKEGAFTLRASNYLVYSNVGDYPMLHSEAVYTWLLIFVAVVFFLFTLYRSFLSPGRFVL